MSENNRPLQIASIYSAYRKALRGLRKSGPQRAGARKQLALKLVSDRYHVKISTVKSIVREQDEINGITHEHDVNYLRELEFMKEAERLLPEHGDNPTCPKCGRIPTESGDSLRVRVNPFEVEIYGEHRPMLSCFRCYLDVDADI